MKAIRVILVVDDEIPILKSLTRLLQHVFVVTVTTAATLVEMQEKAKEVPPDLVIMDGDLRQGENGVEGILRLRTMGCTAAVITHSANDRLVARMITQGAAGSIEKGAEICKPLEVLTQALGYTLSRS